MAPVKAKALNASSQKCRRGKNVLKNGPKSPINQNFDLNKSRQNSITA
jgi:hypothetical protein